MNLFVKIVSKVRKKKSIMDITQFNKELGVKIAIAKRFERKGDIKAAIQEWVEISELALNFSKSSKVDASFKNMIINRTKGIFNHIKELKAGQLKEEVYKDDLRYQEEEPKPEGSPEIILNKEKIMQNEETIQNNISNSTVNINSKIIEDSEFRNLPKGFKEIQPSEDFTIITPHDKDFVEKQRVKAEEIEMLKRKKQEPSEEVIEPIEGVEFELPKNGKNLICFACGYDKNALNDKVCKNCGTELD
ncbi:MAG: hypothetical protein ACFE92_13750 [Promethearchaeota archaeon]